MKHTKGEKFYMSPQNQQLWDGTTKGQRSLLFNKLVQFALSTPAGQAEIKRLSRYQVDTQFGVATLKEKDIAQ